MRNSGLLVPLLSLLLLNDQAQSRIKNPWDELSESDGSSDESSTLVASSPLPPEVSPPSPFTDGSQPPDSSSETDSSSQTEGSENLGWESPSFEMPLPLSPEALAHQFLASLLEPIAASTLPELPATLDFPSPESSWLLEPTNSSLVFQAPPPLGTRRPRLERRNALWGSSVLRVLGLPTGSQ